MPIKRVVCSVCNEEVNKAQTYFVGGDRRACKSHEGVIEKRDQFEARKIQTVVAQKERRTFRAERDQRFSENYSKPHCWLCGVSGLRQDEFFMRVLVEMEKAKQIYGLVNPFDSSHPANQNLAKEPCIFVVAKEKCGDLARFMRPDLRSLPDMAGVYSLCGGCAQKHGVEVLPKVGVDVLLGASAVYETFMKPAVTKQALGEMIRDS